MVLTLSFTRGSCPVFFCLPLSNSTEAVTGDKPQVEFLEVQNIMLGIQMFRVKKKHNLIPILIQSQHSITFLYHLYAACIFTFKTVVIF